nr:hypothetical protein [Streptomyces hygroscopicus]
MARISSMKAAGGLTDQGFLLGEALDHVATRWVDQVRSYYHVIGAPVTGIPLAGDTIQRMVDVGTAEYQNNLNSQVDQETRQHLADHFSAGHQQVDRMLEKAVHEKLPQSQWQLMDQDPGQFENNLQGAGLTRYHDGLTNGVGYMGKPAG